ncbi:hypothetical protein SHIRM173S_01613 [Streptomyces hirsutus]
MSIVQAALSRGPARDAGRTWCGRPPGPGPGPGRKTKEWWNCPGCGWLGRPDLGDRPTLHPFRRLTGEYGECVFCGEEDCNRASEAFVYDDWLCEWIVCVACGRENTRRIKAGA